MSNHTYERLDIYPPSFGIECTYDHVFSPAAHPKSQLLKKMIHRVGGGGIGKKLVKCLTSIGGAWYYAPPIRDVLGRIIGGISFLNRV